MHTPNKESKKDKICEMFVLYVYVPVSAGDGDGVPKLASIFKPSILIKVKLSPKCNLVFICECIWVKPSWVKMHNYDTRRTFKI